MRAYEIHNRADNEGILGYKIGQTIPGDTRAGKVGILGQALGAY